MTTTEPSTVEMWIWPQNPIQNRRGMMIYIGICTMTYTMARMWGYVGKPWMKYKGRSMSPIHRSSTTTDSKNLFYLGLERIGTIL